MCMSLGDHLELIDDELILWPSKHNITVTNKKVFGPMVHHMSLSKTVILIYDLHFGFTVLQEV